MMFWTILMMLATSVAINVYLYNKLRITQEIIENVAQLTASLLELSTATSHGIEGIKRADSFLEED